MEIRIRIPGTPDNFGINLLSEWNHLTIKDP